MKNESGIMKILNLSFLKPKSWNQRKFSRTINSIILLFILVIGIIFIFSSSYLFQPLYQTTFKCQISVDYTNSKAACLMNGAIYRLGLTMFSYYELLGLIAIFNSFVYIQKILDWFWLPKILIILFFFLIYVFAFPNSYIIQLSYLNVYLSGFFLILQMITLNKYPRIFAKIIKRKMQKDDDHLQSIQAKKMFWVIIILGIFLIILSILYSTIIFFGYTDFNYFKLSASIIYLVGNLLTSIISIISYFRKENRNKNSKRRPRLPLCRFNKLIRIIFVIMIASLLFTAIQYIPQNSDNLSYNIIYLIIMYLFLISFLYLTIGNFLVYDPQEISIIFQSRENHTINQIENNIKSNNEFDSERNHVSKFNNENYPKEELFSGLFLQTMGLLSCYLTFLFNNWGTLTINDSKTKYFSSYNEPRQYFLIACLAAFYLSSLLISIIYKPWKKYCSSIII